MNALGWFLIRLFSVSALGTVSMVGKPRTPTTSGTAELAVLLNAMVIASILLWYPR